MPLSRSTSNGFVLVVVLGILSLLAALSVAFVNVAQVERSVCRNYVDLAKATLAAESGVQHAIGKILGWQGGVIRAAEYRDMECQITAFDSDLETATKASFSCGDFPDAICGAVGGTYKENGDAFILQVEDESGKINLNDSNGRWNLDSDPLPDDPATDTDLQNAPGRLTFLLETLLALLWNDSRLATDAATLLMDARAEMPGGRFSSLTEVRRVLQDSLAISTEQWNLLAPHVTVNGWQDPNVLRPTFQLAISAPAATPQPATGYNIYFYSDMQTRSYELEPRAPVNVNTASRQVIQAMIQPVRGWYLYEGEPCSLMDGTLGSWYKARRMASFSHTDCNRNNPKIGGLMLAWPGATTNTAKLGNATRYGEALQTRPIDADIAAAIAGRLHARVHEGIDLNQDGGIDGTDSPDNPERPRPFGTWDEFTRFLYELVDPRADVLDGAVSGTPAPLFQAGLTADEEAERLPYRVAATGECAYVAAPETHGVGALCVTGFDRYQADALLANFNPNSQLNDFNPDCHLFRHVDKAQLTSYTGEFSLQPTGFFRIRSLGLIRDGRGVTAARREIETTLRLFYLLRQTTQSQFMGAPANGGYNTGQPETLYQRFAESNGRWPAANCDMQQGTADGGQLGGPRRRGPAITSYPEPIRNPNSLSVDDNPFAGKNAGFSRFEGFLMLSTWQRQQSDYPRDRGDVRRAPRLLITGEPDPHGSQDPTIPDGTQNPQDPRDPRDPQDPTTTDPSHDTPPSHDLPSGSDTIGAGGATALSPSGASFLSSRFAGEPQAGPPEGPMFMAPMGYRYLPAAERQTWKKKSLAIGGMMPVRLGNNTETNHLALDFYQTPPAPLAPRPVRSDAIDGMDVADGRGVMLCWETDYSKPTVEPVVNMEMYHEYMRSQHHPAPPAWTHDHPWEQTRDWARHWVSHYSHCGMPVYFIGLLGSAAKPDLELAWRVGWNLPSDMPLTNAAPSSDKIKQPAMPVPGNLYPDGAFSEQGRLLSYRATNCGYDWGTQGSILFWVKPHWDAGYSNRSRQLFSMGSLGQLGTHALDLMYWPASRRAQSFQFDGPRDESSVGCLNAYDTSRYTAFPVPTHSLMFGGYGHVWDQYTLSANEPHVHPSYIRGWWIFDQGLVKASPTCTDFFPRRTASQRNEHESIGFYGHQWNLVMMSYLNHEQDGLESFNLVDYSVNGVTIPGAHQSDWKSGSVASANGPIPQSSHPGIPSNVPVLDNYWEENPNYHNLWWDGQITSSVGGYEEKYKPEPRYTEIGQGYMRFGWCTENAGPVSDSTYDEIVTWKHPLDMNAADVRSLWTAGRYCNAALWPQAGGAARHIVGQYESPDLDAFAALPDDAHPATHVMRLHAVAWTLYWPRYNWRPGRSGNPDWRQWPARAGVLRGVDAGNAGEADPVTGDWDPVAIDFRLPDGSWHAQPQTDNAAGDVSTMALSAPGSAISEPTARYTPETPFRYRVNFLMDPAAILLESPVLDDVTFTFIADRPEVVSWTLR